MERVHLIQPAWLISRWHQEEIRSSFRLMGSYLAESNLYGEVFKLLCKLKQLVFVVLVSRSNDCKLKIVLIQKFLKYRMISSQKFCISFLVCDS